MRSEKKSPGARTAPGLSTTSKPNAETSTSKAAVLASLSATKRAAIRKGADALKEQERLERHRDRRLDVLSPRIDRGATILIEIAERQGMNHAAQKKVLADFGYLFSDREIKWLRRSLRWEQARKREQQQAPEIT